MEWITPTNLKLNFAPVKDLTEPQAQEAIDAAEDKLVKFVGQDAVDDTLLESPTNTARATRLVRGHKYLAVSIGVWNTKNIKRQQDPKSPANSQSITNEVWNPKDDIPAVSAYYEGLALNAIGAYLLNDEQGDEYGSGVEYSHPEIESTVCCATAYDCS